MEAADSLFSFAVPLGRFMGTRLKVSVLMLIAVLAVVWRVQSFTTTVMFAAVLFLSVCISEFTHLWMAHRAGLRCPERILWPLGALYGESPRSTLLQVSAAGPLVHFLVAVVAACQLENRQEILSLLNPAQCWSAMQSANMTTLLLRLSFQINAAIAIVSLIPVRPLACGYVLQSFLSRRFPEIAVRDLLLRSGLVLSIFGLLAGFVFDLSGFAALSAFLLLLHVQEAVHWFRPAPPERSFDSDRYADSYKDLERSESELDDFADGEDDIPGSVIDRWKNRRESERDRREREVERLEQDELDRVLEKLHLLGREALSTAELHLLNRVSARLRHKNH